MERPGMLEIMKVWKKKNEYAYVKSKGYNKIYLLKPGGTGGQVVRVELSAVVLYGTVVFPSTNLYSVVDEFISTSSSIPCLVWLISGGKVVETLKF